MAKHWVREFLEKVQSQGQLARAVTVATETVAKMIPKGPEKPKAGESLSEFRQRKAMGAEAHKAYPSGIGKRAIWRGVAGYDYESSVNAQRMAEGKSPDFTAGVLWKSKKHPEGLGQPDADLPAYISRHIEKGTEYLRLRHLTDGSGNATKNWQQLYDIKTGQILTPEEQEYAAKNYLEPEKKAKKQGLEDDVRPRLPELKNIVAIKRDEDAAFTKPGEESNPAAASAGGGGGGGGGGDITEDEINSVPWESPVSDGSGPDEGGKQPTSDEASRMQSAAAAYKSLGKITGSMIGSLFGPGAAPVGAAIGEMVGTLAGGGEIGPKDVMKAAGSVIGGAPGKALSVLSNLLGGSKQSSSGGNSGGGESRSSSGGGSSGGGGSVPSLLNDILACLLRIENNGLVIRNMPGKV